MALIPRFTNDSWWDWPNGPLIGRSFDQRLFESMKNEVDRIESSFGFRPTIEEMQHLLSRGSQIAEPQLVNDKDKFALNMNLSSFRPEEINVKATGNQLLVEGCHEERGGSEGEQRFVSRRFQRSFQLPQDVDVKSLNTQLNQGVLTIAAPKKAAIEP